jgi:hypothetical protein
MRRRFTVDDAEREVAAYNPVSTTKIPAVRIALD